VRARRVRTDWYELIGATRRAARLVVWFVGYVDQDYEDEVRICHEKLLKAKAKPGREFFDLSRANPRPDQRIQPVQVARLSERLVRDTSSAVTSCIDKSGRAYKRQNL